MSLPIDPIGPVDERLQAVLVRALLDLLEAAGFRGGILLAVSDARTLSVVSAIEADLRIAPVDLMRIALERLEASSSPASPPPMNG
jgi:hypothetical protein